MVELNIKLTGNEEDVLAFVALCGKIQLLGEYGASRVIPVDVDGDGSANLKFAAEAEVEGQGKIDLVEMWISKHKIAFQKEIDTKIKNHFIGE